MLKIAFLMAKALQACLYFGAMLLFLRQFLCLLPASRDRTESVICRLTEPFLWCGDCVCRMLGHTVHGGGIDPRYPMAIGILSFCAEAVCGFGGFFS